MLTIMSNSMLIATGFHTSIAVSRDYKQRDLAFSYERVVRLLAFALDASRIGIQRLRAFVQQGTGVA